MSEELRDKLFKGEAVISLLTEQAVASTLRDLDWTTVHGFYYDDPISGKHRELDVASVKNWDYGIRDHYDEVSVRLLIECKSSKEANIIVTRYVIPDWYDRNDYSTRSAAENYIRDETILDSLSAQLAARGHYQSVVSICHQIRARLNEFWRDTNEGALAVLSRYFVRPPPAPVIASTFRETTGIKEKEFDASVFWRAFQSVHSGLTAMELRHREHVLGSAVEAFDLALERHEPLNASVALAFAKLVAITEIFHPLIITHSNLWNLDDNGLQPISWFRFWQVGSSGMPFRWVDVVNAEAFPEFTKELTTYYHEQLGHGIRAQEPISERLYRYVMMIFP